MDKEKDIDMSMATESMHLTELSRSIKSAENYYHAYMDNYYNMVRKTNEVMDQFPPMDEKSFWSKVIHLKREIATNLLLVGKRYENNNEATYEAIKSYFMEKARESGIEYFEVLQFGATFNQKFWEIREKYDFLEQFEGMDDAMDELCYSFLMAGEYYYQKAINEEKLSSEEISEVENTVINIPRILSHIKDIYYLILARFNDFSEYNSLEELKEKCEKQKESE